MIHPQEFLTRKQAAQSLQVSTKSVDKYIRNGWLTCTKIGAKGLRSPVRVSAVSVEKMLQGIR